MNKYYDSSNKRLVFVRNKADAQYWDSLWSADDFPDCVRKVHNSFINNNTSKYLPKGSKILEGGCGRGDKVYALSYAGYDAYGIDYAEETVTRIRETVPELKVQVADIRSVPFPDGFFDGYWSIGVIEHFLEGYGTIAEEMHRVLRKEGYLFMTVPAMSNLRKLKATLKMYPTHENDNQIGDNFYQFALSPESVIDQFTSRGFELIKSCSRDGVKGLKDEIGLLQPQLQWCWDAKSLMARVAKKVLQFMLSDFSGHMKFYIFKKL